MRLIDGDEFLKKFDHAPLIQDAMRKSFDHMPTIEPRKKGKWIRINNEPFADTFKCSECGQEPLIYDFERCLSNYCPNCGADMREGRENA